MFIGYKTLIARLKRMHLLIYPALLLLLFMVYFKPIKSYRCYLRMKSPEIKELTMWHFQNLDEYISIVKEYPTKDKLTRFYPKMRLLNNDLGALGYSIEHIFKDDDFFLILKSNCISSIHPIRWSNGINFWSYLLNGRSLIVSTRNTDLDDLCYGMGTYFVFDGELIINHPLRIEVESFIWSFIEKYNHLYKEKYFAYCLYCASDNTIEILCEDNLKESVDSAFFLNLAHELNRLTQHVEVDSIYFSIRININDFAPE